MATGRAAPRRRPRSLIASLLALGAFLISRRGTRTNGYERFSHPFTAPSKILGDCERDKRLLTRTNGYDRQDACGRPRTPAETRFIAPTFSLSPQWGEGGVRGETVRLRSLAMSPSDAPGRELRVYLS